MSVLETIEVIRSWLMWIGLGVLLLIAAGCAFAGLRRVSRKLYVRLSPVAIVVFAVAAIFATCEAQKRLLRDGGGRGATALPGVTAEEIVQGWRLESVTTNDAVSYAMPTNGVEHAPWSLRGGYETHFPLDLDFAFPFGTGMVHRLDVLSGGMVESLPRQRVEGRYSSAMSICAAREWASIVPGVGRFWWAAGTTGGPPYQAALLSWENVFAGRDCTGQYNAQIELRGDGNFVTRSNNVERVYRRVLPYDWDNDGLPNAIDPAPVTPIVPSAWNQSEEWAATAFPSNAAEIAAVGGYAAWAAARAEEPDRRLVTLGVAFDDGGAWPTLLDFGGVPVVQSRTIPVRAFVVEAPKDSWSERWRHQEIESMLDTANEIFTQVGIRFELVGAPLNLGTTNDWDISVCDVTTNSVGEVSYSEYATAQFASLLNSYRANDCVEVYLTGSLQNPKMNAVTCPLGVIISKIHTRHTLAHELGHALGLKDILRRLKVDDGGQIITLNLGIGGNVVDRTIFADFGHDWCQETGRGFYARSDTIASVIDKLLMCGVEDTDSEEVSYGDIPYGQVYGLSKYLEKDFQKVGVSDIETSNGKVYSK